MAILEKVNRMHNCIYKILPFIKERGKWVFVDIMIYISKTDE